MQNEPAKDKRQVLLIAGLLALCVLALIVTVAIFSLFDQERLVARHDVEAARPFSRPDVVVGLQPLGAGVSPELLAYHAARVQERFGARVVLLEARPLPDAALNPTRAQHRATALLDQLYLWKPAHVTHMVALTTADLYEDRWAYLYGFSQTGVAVYSLARFEADADRVADSRRLEKVLYHELGHALGLPHCDSDRCVMIAAGQPEALDHASAGFCPRCARALRREGRAAPTPPADALLARGDGLYQRGAVQRAQWRYTLALLHAPTRPEVLGRLGVGAMATRQPRLADLAFRLQLARNPEEASAFYNLALLYAPLDTSVAMRLLDAGLSVDEDHVSALGFLAAVSMDHFGDEHRALGYLERYLEAGGSDPSVLYRYAMLTQGRALTFRRGTWIRSELGRAASWSLRLGVLRVQLAVVWDGLRERLSAGG